MHVQLFLRSNMHRPHRYSNSGSVGVTAPCTFEQHVVSKYKLTNVSKSLAADGAEVPPSSELQSDLGACPQHLATTNLPQSVVVKHLYLEVIQYFTYAINARRLLRPLAVSHHCSWVTAKPPWQLQLSWKALWWSMCTAALTLP